MIHPFQSSRFLLESHSESVLAFTWPPQPEISISLSAPMPWIRYPVAEFRSMSMNARRVSIVGGDPPPRSAVPFTSK